MTDKVIEINPSHTEALSQKEGVLNELKEK